MSRRYVIIGAGAIGGSLAAELTLAGRDVLLIARGEHGRVVGERGLTLRRPTGDVTVPLTVAASPGEAVLTSDDILVLAVKTQDAESVLAEWAWLPVEGGGVAADLPLFTFQNGLVTEVLALRRFSSVYGVTIGIAASYLEPGVVVSPSLPPAVGVVAVGRYPSGRDDLQDDVTADLVAAGYVATSTSVIQEWKAFKLLGNIANGLDLFDGDSAERDAVKSELVAEAKAVFTAAGIVWATQKDAVEAGWGGLEILPVQGHRGGKLSTWQSFARGTSSEVDYLNGEIVLLGRLHSVPTPANSAVQRVLGGLSLVPRQEGAAPTAGPLAGLREAVAVPASW